MSPVSCAVDVTGGRRPDRWCCHRLGFSPGGIYRGRVRGSDLAFPGTRSLVREGSPTARPVCLATHMSLQCADPRGAPRCRRYRDRESGAESPLSRLMSGLRFSHSEQSFRGATGSGNVSVWRRSRQVMISRDRGRSRVDGPPARDGNTPASGHRLTARKPRRQVTDVRKDDVRVAFQVGLRGRAGQNADTKHPGGPSGDKVMD